MKKEIEILSTSTIHYSLDPYGANRRSLDMAWGQGDSTACPRNLSLLHESDPSLRSPSDHVLVVHSAYKFVASGTKLVELYILASRIDFRSPPLRMVTGQEEA